MKSKPNLKHAQRKLKVARKDVSDCSQALEAALDHIEKLQKENRDLRLEVENLEMSLAECRSELDLLQNQREELD